MLVRVLYTRPDASPRLPFQGRWILRSKIQRGSRIRGLRPCFLPLHKPNSAVEFARIRGLRRQLLVTKKTVRGIEIRTYLRAASAKPNSFSKQFDFAFS